MITYKRNNFLFFHHLCFSGRFRRNHYLFPRENKKTCGMEHPAGFIFLYQLNYRVNPSFSASAITNFVASSFSLGISPSRIASFTFSFRIPISRRLKVKHFHNLFTGNRRLKVSYLIFFLYFFDLLRLHIQSFF